MEPLLFVEIFVSTVIGRFRSKMHYEKKDIDCTRDPFQSSQLEYHSSPGQEKNGEFEKSRYGSIPIAR
jgi:hypothetical protein